MGTEQIFDRAGGEECDGGEIVAVSCQIHACNDATERMPAYHPFLDFGKLRLQAGGDIGI